MREGRDEAGSVLPPSNTGHMGTWEVLGAQFGNEPDRLTQQLDRYVNFAFKPQPLVRDAVEAHATDSTELDPDS